MTYICIYSVGLHIHGLHSCLYSYGLYSRGLYRYGLCSSCLYCYDLHSKGLRSHGLYSYGPYSHGRSSYDSGGSGREDFPFWYTSTDGMHRSLFTHFWVDGRAGAETDRQRQSVGRADGRADGRTDGWMNARTDGRADGQEACPLQAHCMACLPDAQDGPTDWATSRDAACDQACHRQATSACGLAGHYCVWPGGSPVCAWPGGPLACA